MEIAQFHLSNIKSGMFPSMAINMANGIPTREERRTIERQINAKLYKNHTLRGRPSKKQRRTMNRFKENNF